ncbi:hypothetical protein HMPREF0358_2025, partial [Escherichia coli 83972]
NSGTPPTVAPPWLPTIATRVPITRATTIAMSEEREELARVGVGEDMCAFRCSEVQVFDGVCCTIQHDAPLQLQGRGDEST